MDHVVQVVSTALGGFRPPQLGLQWFLPRPFATMRAVFHRLARFCSSSLFFVAIQAAFIMKFIEMTGKVLKEIIKEDELHMADLGSAGIADDTIVRVNEQGDIEVRRIDRWDCIGGLLGNYEHRIKKRTGMDWA